jgi:O-antigen ligase
VGVALLSLSLLFVVNKLRSKSMLSRVSGWMIVFLVVAVLAGGLLHGINRKSASDFTEGRTDIWSVAWNKFLERPIVGYGYDSWRDDLVSRLPGEYALTSEIAAHIRGGYHNQYLTLLAEDGLIAFLPALAIFWLLSRWSYSLAVQKLPSAVNGQMILFGCCFLLVRAGIESPGLFGSGQGPPDYLAYCFLAIVVSQVSAYEDALSAMISKNQLRCAVAGLRRASLAHSGSSV